MLEPILDDPEKLMDFLIDHSSLPGPRSNLELAFAFAAIYVNDRVVKSWASSTGDRYGDNDPASFPAFCAAICLGKIYTVTREKEIIDILKDLANDKRWRMREAVAFAFQLIGENDFNELKKIITGWIDHSTNLGKRAILVSLAHPPFLNTETATFCIEITDVILKAPDTREHFDVLRKGLEFTISVFVAADPVTGFAFFEKWIGKDRMIDKILLKNLQKNRLVKKFPEKVNRLSGLINLSC